MLLNKTSLVFPRLYSPTLVKEDRHSYNQKQRNRKYTESTLLKRVPLERLMDLKIDYAFKQLFNQEENKANTVVFING